MSTNNELRIIRQALLNELEAHDFYTLAAGQAASPEAREAFEDLAAEEQKHIDWLRDLYKNITGNTIQDFDPSFEEPSSPGLHNLDVIGRESGSYLYRYLASELTWKKQRWIITVRLLNRPNYLLLRNFTSS